MPARRAALLVVAAALAIPSLTEAAALRATVASVTDGDSVKLKVGKRTRAFSLAALNAPEGTECFAAESKARLKALLPNGARVKGSTRGRSATLTRGGKNVNREMVRGGFARAAGSRLAPEEAAAKAAGAGLWKACAGNPSPGPSPGPTPTPTPDPGPQPPAPMPDVTGQAAIDRMTQEIRGARWRDFSSDSTIEYILNLCSDDAWLQTSNSTQVGFSYKGGRPWRVIEALIKGDGSYRYAKVQGTITSADPAADSSTHTTVLEVVAKEGGESWYWAGDLSIHEPGQANCQGL